MSNSQSVIAKNIRCCPEDIEKAFWQLWQQNRDYLYRCCLRWMGGNPTDAEEVLSRAMLKAWDKLPDYAEKITNLRAGLTRLTHNLCIDIHRERRRKAMQMEDIEEIAATGNSAFISGLDSPEEALLHHKLGKYIRRAIDTLPSRLRNPFILLLVGLIFFLVRILVLAILHTCVISTHFLTSKNSDIHQGDRSSENVKMKNDS